MDFEEFKKKYQKKEVKKYQGQVNKNVLVSVCIQTFQHVKYIKKCLDSILIQQTNFDFEILLGEDASTDGTREICIEYAQKYSDKIQLFLHHRENNIQIGDKPSGRFNFLYNLYSAKGKYIALCEGDDYWTDPLKLQKQVDFLERNTAYNICWTRYHVLMDNKISNPEWENKFNFSDKHDIDFNNFASPYCTYTLTAVFKTDSINKINRIKFKHIKDNTIYSLCLNEGKGAILDFYSGVYRIHSMGVYSLASNLQQATSNYFNYHEILQLIPNSRVPNIIYKVRYWKGQWEKEMKKQKFGKIKLIIHKIKTSINV